MHQTALGQYRLIERLGGGGMGEVFLAQLEREEGFTRRLVVKRMLPELSGDPRFRAMFVTEARIAAGLNHPHVVGVIDFGRIGPDCFLAMEYVDGADLATLLQRARTAGQKPPLEFVLGVMLGCLRGLGYAHRRDPPVVHGDVSPANLLVGREGEVKLADFGLARVAAGSAAAGGLQGKPAYMAPEVAAGCAASCESDLYAAGAVLYEMLSLAPPRADNPDAARRGHIVPLADTQADAHPALATICNRALAANPRERFADADHMEQALAQVAHMESLDTGPRAVGTWVQAMSAGQARSAPAPVERTLVASGRDTRRGSRRNRLVVPMLAVLVATAVALLVWTLSRDNNQRADTTAPATDAGSTPYEEDAGSTPYEEDAGSTPYEEDAGSTLYEEDTGSTLYQKDAGVVMSPIDAGKPSPDTRRAGIHHAEARAKTTHTTTRDAGTVRYPEDAGLPGSDQVQLATTSPGLQLRANRPVLISLNGADEQPAPLVVRSGLQGAHLLSIRDPEGLGATIRLEATVSDAPLRLAVRSHPFAVLYLDGRARGMTPKAGLRLQPGAHTLTLAAKQHPPLVLELEVR